MKRRDPSAVLVVCASILAGLALTIIAGRMEAADTELERAHYCRMIETHQQTGGEYGWPDYRNEYEEICDE